MKPAVAMAALAGLVLAVVPAARGEEPPIFERDGLPITSHQVQVLGSNGVEEQPTASVLTLDGMPASPHQLEVLSHGKHEAH